MRAPTTPECTRVHDNSGRRKRASKIKRTLDMLCSPFLYSAHFSLVARIALSNSKTTESASLSDSEATGPGRLLALDLGRKRVGVAVSDELGISVRPLPPLRRTSWKQLVHNVAALVRDFDARILVIGLPLSLNGTAKTAAEEIKRQARNFELSLAIPVVLQDERLTTKEAEQDLRAAGCDEAEVRDRVDSEAAALILRDYLSKRVG